MRRYDDVSIDELGYSSSLWSSSPYSNSTRRMYLKYDGSIIINNISRAEGLALRCFKDSYSNSVTIYPK